MFLDFEGDYKHQMHYILFYHCFQLKCIFILHLIIICQNAVNQCFVGKKKKKHSNLSQGRMDEQQIKPYFLRGSLGFSGDLHHVTLCLRQSPHNPGSVSKPTHCTVDNVQIS